MSIFRRRTESQAKHFVFANFEDYQDGTLSEADTAFYRQHLIDCQHCRDWDSQQLHLVEQLEIELSPPARLSPAAAERIHQDIYRRMRRANLMNNLRITFGAVATIAIIAILLGAFIWWQSGNIDEPEQTTILEQETPAPEPLWQDSLNELLVEAIKSAEPAEVERLLDEGADPSFRDSSGAPVLKSEINRARSSGNIDNIRLLLEYGADVNALDSQGNGLLPLAARNGLLEVVKLMIEAGADISATMTYGDRSTPGLGSLENATALNLAALNGHLEVVNLLVVHGADVDAPETFYNRTPLHGAAWQNNHEIVQLLIEKGAELNPQHTLDGSTPLHYAAENGSTEVVQVLVDANPNLDVQTENGMTPLMSTLVGDARYKPEIISLLLAGGANPNLQDNDGNAALHYASNNRRVEAIPILIEHGAALDLENNEGKTAADVAATEEITELLRAAGSGE